ncbi:PQQ-binding-like beta-propeller repeat protein [Leifsonia sp. NPDC058194]|uniref:outer membrane protein assembly factor BamB family protein n=1 Tax=Leifsonia sp. NPDC058194 TaxID=3346374 RepID=UPI0036D7D962
MTTAGPVFDPARSAALRDILHETVAAGPARPSRTRFALIGGLVGAAVLLAGGTAALALTGALHFGSPEPVPVPTTPSPSVTPTPTPTPTVATPRVVVTSGTILPHDVDSLPAQSRWALDLPGIDDGCRMLPQSYDINDGLAVILSGARPKEYEGGPCAQGSRDEKVGLTLVDTTDGEIVWQRTWEYVSDQANASQVTRFRLLGTSGRAIFVSTDDVNGAHDVIDLTTGATVATIDPSLTYAVPVPGPSGDLVVTSDPTRTRAENRGTISRLDPRDPDHPRWTTGVDAQYVSVSSGTRDPSALPVFSSTGDAAGQAVAMVDLETGSLTKVTGVSDFDRGLDAVTLWRAPAPDGSATTVALDDTGKRLWSRPAAAGSYLVTVTTPGARPGDEYFDLPSTGELAVVDRSSISLIDQLTGDTVWESSLAGCDPVDFLGVPSAYEDAALSAITVRFSQDRSCSFDRETGALLPKVGIPYDYFAALGQRNVYVNPYDSDTGTAYDGATGASLWTLPQRTGERWAFAGGYLVRAFGNHVESIG